MRSHTASHVRSLTAALVLLAALLVPASAQADTTCGEFVDHDLILEHDLICLDDALIVEAPGVTIDLNGHRVSSETGTAISTQSDRTHITGGVISGRTGVFIGDSRQGRLTHTEITSSLEPLTIRGGKRNLIRHNSIHDVDGGVTLRQSSHNRVLDNEIVHSAMSAVSIQGGGKNLIRRNMLDGDRMVLVLSSHGDVIADNESAARSNSGIEIDFAHGVRVLRNTVRVSNNAIHVVGAKRTAIRRNRVRGFTGIFISSKADRSRVMRNRANLAIDTGIGVTEDSTRTLLRRNFVTRTQEGNGISVFSRSATLAWNRSHRNAGLGIAAARAVRDKGHNRARLNGDPRQCVGVRCRP